MPKFRLHKTAKSFMGNGIRFYNKIPINITELTEKKIKTHARKVLIEKAYYEIDNYVKDRDVWC